MCTLIQLIENKELDSYRRVYLAEKPKSKLLPCFAWFVNGPNNWRYFYRIWHTENTKRPKSITIEDSINAVIDNNSQLVPPVGIAFLTNSLAR